jgi:hypothetical protein
MLIVIKMLIVSSPTFNVRYAHTPACLCARKRERCAAASLVCKGLRDE